MSYYNMAAVTRGPQLGRTLRTTSRFLASRSTVHRPARAPICSIAPTGWSRHAISRYCSNTTAGAVRLAYTLHESDDAATGSALPPIVAVDGLFGRRKNLATVCKALAAATGRNVYAVDLRNHGDSPHTEDMTYALTNADLELFLQDRGLSKVVFMGHSMAGRVVMKFAVTKPSAVERLVIADVAARTLPPALLSQWLPWQLNAMEHILSLLSPDMSLDHALQVADQYLSRQLKDPYFRSFLLGNLCRGPRGYEWQANVKAFWKNIPSMGSSHYLDNERSSVDALFVASDGSIYLTADDLEDIKRTFPNARVVTVKGAHHWLHNDKTEEFVELVRDFMTSRRPEAPPTSLPSA